MPLGSTTVHAQAGFRTALGRRNEERDPHLSHPVHNHGVLAVHAVGHNGNIHVFPHALLHHPEGPCPQRCTPSQCQLPCMDGAQATHREWGRQGRGGTAAATVGAPEVSLPPERMDKTRRQHPCALERGTRRATTTHTMSRLLCSAAILQCTMGKCPGGVGFSASVAKTFDGGMLRVLVAALALALARGATTTKKITAYCDGGTGGKPVVRGGLGQARH